MKYELSHVVEASSKEEAAIVFANWVDKTQDMNEMTIKPLT